MKRIILALGISFVAVGCYEARPAVVQPQYIARCPEGYRYDGYNCRREYARPPARVDVRIR